MPDAAPPPAKVKVVEPGGVVDRPVKAPRPVEEQAAIRTKVREAEQTVAKLPRPRQKAIFEEEALAAGREKEFKALTAALRRGAGPEDWVHTINPTGNRADVVAAVNAVDAALGKVPRTTKTGGALTAEAVAAAHDSMVTQVADLHDVGHFLAKAGPGARGVVAVQVTVPVTWANRAPVAIGHAFNAGNVDGRIVFLDPQTGVVAATPHDLLTAAGYDPATITSADFVPTHPTVL
jgi:hypothetical protein